MDEDFAIPQYYVVRKGLNDAETEIILFALKITPVVCCVITDAADAAFALKLSNEVMRTYSAEDSHALAKRLSKDTGKPALVIGDAEFIDAYYEDGSKEALPNGNVN